MLAPPENRSPLERTLTLKPSARRSGRNAVSGGCSLVPGTYLRWLALTLVLLAGSIGSSPCLAGLQVVQPAEPPTSKKQDRVKPIPTVNRQPLIPKRKLGRVATSRRSMVAAVHPLATDAGLDAIERGGNAVDAAVAAALTLGVVDGFNSGIGGGCFILIRCPDGTVVAIDGREMAPAAAHVDLFKDAVEAQRKLGGSNLQPSRTGPLASGVPGALAAFATAVSQQGKLKLPALINPAAEIAERGFVVTEAYQNKIASVEATLKQYPGSRSVLLRADGQGQLRGYRAGEVLVQQDLANTYRTIGREGIQWFYNGPFAKQTAQWMNANGGILTEADFANYQVKQRQPVVTQYRGHTVIGFPPPSSGGVHVGQILNILQHFDLKTLHANRPEQMYHVVGEAMKLAFADRAHWLGDPDFVDVPRGLVDPAYASELAKKISLEKTVTTSYGTPPGSERDFFERHTTHIAAADAEGYFVAITSTVNTTFGSKVIVPGLGVVMNNQMDDFVAILDKPNAFGLVGGKRNAVAPRKRPLSSMSPTIVLKDNQPILTLGAAGGPKIITEVVNAIVHHIDLGQPIDQAIAQPRLHHQWSPDRLMVESGFPPSLSQKLESMGHSIQRISAAGICQAISFDPKTGSFRGCADPRTTGAAGGN